jgi:hypothetical protein
VGGIQILANSSQGAVFYSSSSEWAFGPLMPDEDVAEAFLRTFSRMDDPRLLSDAELEKRWYKFREKLTCPEGHTNSTLTNFGDGVTHIACMQRGCSNVWDLEGNIVKDEEEDL